jgi:nitrogen regulatory protein P-II 1
MYMILCVIDQPDRLASILQAWRQDGITGVTILESTGLHRLSKQAHIPMRYAFGNPSSDVGNITLFTVVESEEMIQRCLDLTEAIVGDFNGPNTGIFISWPIGFSKGVSGKQAH